MWAMCQLDAGERHFRRVDSDVNGSASTRWCVSVTGGGRGEGIHDE
jgi:hypothetical protein